MKRLLIFFMIVLSIFDGLDAQQRGGRGLVDRSQESDSYLTISIGPEYCESDTEGQLWNQVPLIGSNANKGLFDYDVSIGYRTTFANNLGYKVAFSYSSFGGNDIGSKYPRRYDYNSNVLQLAIQGEYTVKIGHQYYYKATPNSIYVFLGAGVLRADANLNYNVLAHYVYGKNTIAPVIPLGLGYQHNFNNNFLIGIEFNGRYPFTDLIDGFKPPYPESKSNDIMGGVSFTISYLLGQPYLSRY
jgi:hypothetical protein